MSKGRSPRKRKSKAKHRASPIPRVPIPPESWWDWLQRVFFRPIEVALGLGTALIVVYGAFFVRPAVSVSYEDPDDLLSVPFQIQNGHYATMYNLFPKCVVEDAYYNGPGTKSGCAQRILAANRDDMSDLTYNDTRISYCRVRDAVGLFDPPIHFEFIVLTMITEYELQVLPFVPRWTPQNRPVVDT